MRHGGNLVQGASCEFSDKGYLEAVKNRYNPCNGCPRTGGSRNCTPVRCKKLAKHQKALDVLDGKNGQAITSLHQLTFCLPRSSLAHRPGNRGAH